MDKSFEHDIEILDSVRKKIEEEGDNHFLSNLDTPILDNAFDLSDEEKISKIEEHFREIMKILGLDLNDDSLKGTPYRVAKMYVKEMFSGLDPKNKPPVSLFENKYEYGDMVVEKNITFYSNCEHHFVPIIGKAHIGYISSGNVIGLSKMHRIVNFYAKRPQVQERMTIQIINELKSSLNTEDIGLVVDADHLCVSSRGIKDITSSTITVESSGKFKDKNTWNKFVSLVNSDNIEK